MLLYIHHLCESREEKFTGVKPLKVVDMDSRTWAMTGYAMFNRENIKGPKTRTRHPPPTEPNTLKFYEGRVDVDRRRVWYLHAIVLQC